MLKGTPWSSGVNLGGLFAIAQKEKNRKQVNTMGAAELASSSSSSSSMGPSKLTEEEIMAQGAKWEAENNANRIKRAELAKAKLAKNIANNATRNKSRNAANLAKFKANFAKREQTRLEAMVWPDYMEEMYPGIAQRGPVYENNSSSAARYRPPPGYHIVGTSAAAGAGKPSYNPYGAVRYNGTIRYRKNYKPRKTRKARKTRKNNK